MPVKNKNPQSMFLSITGTLTFQSNCDNSRQKQYRPQQKVLNLKPKTGIVQKQRDKLQEKKKKKTLMILGQARITRMLGRGLIPLPYTTTINNKFSVQKQKNKNVFFVFFYFVLQKVKPSISLRRVAPYLYLSHSSTAAVRSSRNPFSMFPLAI